MTNILDTIEKNIKNIDEELKEDYISYYIESLLKNNKNNINIYNYIVINILNKYKINNSSKIEYEKNENKKIILISQYYIAKDEQRYKENNICLLNNILNENIDKIILLNEREYDLSFILNKLRDNKLKNKVKQVIIECRINYFDVFNYVNTYYKNNIILLGNLDIFYNESLKKLKNYNLTNKFISLTRYDLLEDYKFNEPNEIKLYTHEGILGNPCIDSSDCWIFKSPIKNNNNTKVMLGSNGCDTIINYILKYELNYDVINIVNDIISIHYHLGIYEKRYDYLSNRIMSHSGEVYNNNNDFIPENYNHMYLEHTNVKLCNKIESFCTFCTKSSYKDLRLLLLSLELYHNDIPIYIIADSVIKTMIENDKYDLNIKIRVELDKYTNMNRQIMEELNIFTEFLLKKADVMDYALEENDTVLFLDSDIMLLNKMDLLIDNKYDVGLSRHNIKEEYSSKFGIYNAGFIYIKNKSVTDNWRELVKTRGGFVDQQVLDYFSEKYEVYEFDNSYNYGWWRLFQSHNIEKNINNFFVNDSNIYYEYKTLKCVHTHFYQNNDGMVIEFNRIIRDLMKKINHKMLYNIDNNKIKEINTEEKINKEEEKINKEEEKINIIIPAFRNDFWNHANDTFRELVMLWQRDNLCNIIEKDTKHVWWEDIGKILLYDRPIMDWINQDNELKYEKILVGNPIYNKELMGIGNQWIFWGRRPSILENIISKGLLKYEERNIESIFIGKIENLVQKKYRIDNEIKWENYVELYKMHDMNENYLYTNEEYLNLLKHSKFGLCLRGYGGKCNREIELMGLGVIPIVMNDVDMNYYDNLIEKVHYFRINNGNELKEIIKNCSKEQWILMSNNIINWYNKNCSSIGSFNTTKEIIEKLYEKEELNNVFEKEKIVYNKGNYEKFIRKNLSSYYNINNIIENHKKNHSDIKWDNLNKFNKGYNMEIKYINNVNINTNGIMYNDKIIYEYDNIYDKKLIIKKKIIDLYDDNMIVFNLVQKWGYGYYHWLAEIYSRLFLIKEFINSIKLNKKKIVLMLYYNETFIKECLEIINIENVHILPYNDLYEYKIKHVYMCNPIRYGNPSRENINIIRNGLFNNNILIGNINIIIKRINGSRIINNFDEMTESLLRNYGNYNWIIFENLNMIETINLFQRAKLIIGAHGAGLTNMIFSPKGTNIIELMTNEMGNICYWHLAELLEMNYKIVPVNGTAEIGLDVDIEKLNYTVDKLLNNIFTIENMY